MPDLIPVAPRPQVRWSTEGCGVSRGGCGRRCPCCTAAVESDNLRRRALRLPPELGPDHRAARGATCARRCASYCRLRAHAPGSRRAHCDRRGRQWRRARPYTVCLGVRTFISRQRGRAWSRLGDQWARGRRLDPLRAWHCGPQRGVDTHDGRLLRGRVRLPSIRTANPPMNVRVRRGPPLMLLSSTA